MEVRGPVGDWHALRSNPDYRADWRAHGGAPSVVESAGFPLRAQTEADLEAARWGLLAWEDPRERSRFKPFWIDEGMLRAEVGERGDPVGAIARVSGMTVTGLRLLDGALVLKVKRWRRVEQIRIPRGGFVRPGADRSRTVVCVRRVSADGSAQAVQLHRYHGDAKEASTEAVGDLGQRPFRDRPGRAPGRPMPDSTPAPPPSNATGTAARVLARWPDKTVRPPAPAGRRYVPPGGR